MDEYWKQQVDLLKHKSTSELNALLKGQSEFLNRRPEEHFTGIRNYLQYIKLELAERIGKRKEV